MKLSIVFLVLIVFQFKNVNCRKKRMTLEVFSKCFIQSVPTQLKTYIVKIPKGEKAFMYRRMFSGVSSRQIKRVSHLRNENSSADSFYNREIGSTGSDSFPYLIKLEQSNNVLAYTNDIDKDCFTQIKNLAKLPIIKGHVTILPDVHLGKGIIIGSVFLTEHFIIPNGVGVDIGCGILCAKIKNCKKKKLTDTKINNIYNKIKKRVPLSFDYHEKEVFNSKDFFYNLINQNGSKIIKELVQSKHVKQLGSLGGGNHFIEIVYDASDIVAKEEEEEKKIYINNNADGYSNGQHKLQDKCDEFDVYILIHSGSRNLGKTVAEYYDMLASEESNMKRNDLAYLNLHNVNGQNYLMDMKVCMEYAKQNRIYMMKIIEDIIYEELHCKLDWDNSINIHHNFCNFEKVTFFDKQKNKVEHKFMYVTRKGSTSSKKGELGIIPGNMKVGSYIVKGKGNILSYNSCSHGCGRLLSRTKAKQLISQNDFVQAMKGIKCDTHQKIKDEAPQAYKNLDQVLKNQNTIIDILKKLLPIINIKGF